MVTAAYIPSDLSGAWIPSAEPANGGDKVTGNVRRRRHSIAYHADGTSDGESVYGTDSEHNLLAQTVKHNKLSADIPRTRSVQSRNEFGLLLRFRRSLVGSISKHAPACQASEVHFEREARRILAHDWATSRVSVHTLEMDPGSSTIF